jgi:hypothetical protein
MAHHWRTRPRAIGIPAISRRAWHMPRVLWVSLYRSRRVHLHLRVSWHTHPSRPAVSRHPTRLHQCVSMSVPTSSSQTPQRTHSNRVVTRARTPAPGRTRRLDKNPASPWRLRASLEASARLQNSQRQRIASTQSHVYKRILKKPRNRAKRGIEVVCLENVWHDWVFYIRAFRVLANNS